MHVLTVNFWPVLAAGVLVTIIGFLWYSPVLFGKTWMKLVKSTSEKEALRQSSGQAASKSMAKPLTIHLIANILLAYVLALFVVNLVVATAWAGAQLGFFIWLGFIITTTIADYLWSSEPEGKPWGLYYLNAGYMLVALAAAGALLAVWI